MYGCTDQDVVEPELTLLEAARDVLGGRSMKIKRRYWAAAAVAGGLLLGACGGATEAPKAETLGTSSQELLALSLAVNSSILGSPGVVLHVTGPSYDATITGPNSTRLPAITRDGTYTIASPAGEASFGTFVVEGGIVVHSTGAVTFASSGLSFNAAKLALVTIPTTGLTIPGGLGRFRLGNASNVFTSAPFFRLPDGTFSVTAADGTRPIGTFTIAARIVTATTGAVVKLGPGIAFNTALLARVTLPIPTLSTPSNLVTARLGDDTNATGSMLTVFLADGVYTVTNSDKDRVFGDFTVAGRVVTATSGGIMPSPTTGIAFNRAALAEVTVDTGALATAAGYQPVRIAKISTSALSSATLWLPPGAYDVDDAIATTTPPRRYGAFTVTGTSVTSATGALTPSPSGFTFDTSGLTEVTIPFSALQSPGSPSVLGGRLSLTSAIMGAAGGDPTLHLLDGRYTVSRVPSGSWGTFDVANHEVVAGSGVFKAGSTGQLEIQTCGVSAVTINTLPPPAGGAFRVAEIMPAPLSYSGGTLLLPPGLYTIVSTTPGRPTGRFFVPTQGPITNVIQPSWLGTISGTSVGACLRAPIARCIGTATAPVEVGFCSVAADATNNLAGSCTNNGGGVASCTFDGLDTRTLSSGDHAVRVIGSASDGASSACTSFVRVHPCGDAPIVKCVGTVASPVLVQTNPGTCGAAVSNITKAAGTCRPGADGLASCTFNGQSATTLAAGTYAVTLAGTSLNGTSASCTSHITVIDKERPQLACAAPVTRECEGPLTTATTTATCSDNCGVCASECDSRALAVGQGSTLRCNTVDPTGNVNQCFAQVNIVDTVAPSLQMAVSPSVLWPPSHNMHEISITTSTTDLCDPWAYVQCTASSNEAPLGLGSGNTPVDIEWRDDPNGGAPRLYLRAERSGLGNSRVYTIECTSSDQSGNATTKTATVTVPHDQGPGQ